jgi:hypothetical protein
MTKRELITLLGSDGASHLAGSFYIEGARVWNESKTP